jgi:hypothetical protein
MNKNTFSISILIIGLILAFLLFSIFGILYFYWGDFKAVQDSLSTTGSLFGVIGTLGAAAVAAYLFNDWRDEKNYDLENSILTNILIDLKLIYVELHKIRSDSHNLKKIDKFLIIKTDYLERERIDIYKSIISLFPNIKIYSEIKKDDTLINLYHSFDKHCFIMDDFYRDLFFKKYQRYYDLTEEVNSIIKAGSSNSKRNYDIYRPYSENRKDSLRIEIAEILRFFEKDELVAIIDNKPQNTTYETWLNETIKLHDEIRDYCIEHLKVTEMERQ